MTRSSIMHRWQRGLEETLADFAPAAWPETLARATAALAPQRNGNLARWWAVLEALPQAATGWHIADGVVVAGTRPEPDARDGLLELCPWRKGPFRLADIFIDSEWRSDRKWARIGSHIELRGHTVLDVGAGNGYFGWRMLQAGARRVIGCDPTLLYLMQYLAVTHFAGPTANQLLPLPLETLPAELAGFDTVFSMGVLYHRRDPLQHLRELRQRLAPGGRLVLETLILPGARAAVLQPDGRYANMRNVHAIPTLRRLTDWLAESGFGAVRCVDQTRTTSAEQRPTEWMRFHSLEQALAEHGCTTIEGHPPPLRAMLVAVAE